MSNVGASLPGKQAKAYQGSDDLEVDIITYTNANATRSPVAEDPDATEYSSSFADTISDTEKGSGLSETEVESQFFFDSDLTSPYDAFNSMFQTRKKKVTDHWRSFIRPIMWRCRWTELKIKEIESQGLKYARKLAACEQRKHPEVYQPSFEGHSSKSLPFSNRFYGNKAAKRRKRKRIEEITNNTTYMSQHVIFSYLETKRSNQDGSSVLDDFGNTVIEQHVDYNDKFGIDHNQLFLDFKEGDSLERVLWRIEVVQSRVHRLKNQLDLVMPKNAARFSSSENLSLLAPFDAQTSSAPSPTFSAGNGEALSIGAINNATQHISGYDFGDLNLPEGAISSYREAIHVPDIIESTVGLLSAADVTFHQPQIGDSCEYIVDNEVNNGERHAVTGTSEPLIEGHYQLSRVKHEHSTDPCSTLAPEVDAIALTSIIPKEEPCRQSCLPSDFPCAGSKRKRGERKAGSVGWSKKCSDEPDSQSDL